MLIAGMGGTRIKQPGRELAPVLSAVGPSAESQQRRQQMTGPDAAMSDRMPGLSSRRQKPSGG
jgi:hypothetical protein